MKGVSISSRFLACLTPLLFALIALSCETIIDPELESADPVLVVDAWINNRPEAQVIMLTRTQGYFDTAPLTGVVGAQVKVTNTTTNEVFLFTPAATPGEYVWEPEGIGESIGVTGNKFSLQVIAGGQEYRSTATLGRVPAIDSITFTFQPGGSFFPDSYIAEFYAVDPPGKGDTYWIKAWKNDTLLLRPSEINVAFDGGFSEGGNIDGVNFITPIRQAINPAVTDKDGRPLSPYVIGDSVYVEIHSITRQAFDFLNQVAIQTDRPGGFSELFAAPMSNVGTNIVNANPTGEIAIGFFNVSTIAAAGKRLKQKK
ncbi:MAG: DUF4249 domain-containing protein [Bacteroidota bacterium]